MFETLSAVLAAPVFKDIILTYIEFLDTQVDGNFTGQEKVICPSCKSHVTKYSTSIICESCEAICEILHDRWLDVSTGRSNAKKNV